MMKFFYFRILGDDVNPKEIEMAVKLPCRIFFKDEVVYYHNWPLRPQKTNRWLYRADSSGKNDLSSFLTNQLKRIKKHLPELLPFLKKHHAMIEYVIYADDNTHIMLSVKQIRLLELIGVKFSICFC